MSDGESAEQVPQKREKSKTLLRVFSYLKRYPLLGGLQFFCALLGTSLVFVYPKVTQQIIDVVLPSKDAGLLWKMLGLGLGAFLLRDGLEILRIRLNNIFEQKVIYDLRSDLYERIQRLPLSWFHDHPTGDVMTRVAEDVTSMERVIIDGVEQGAVALLHILVIVVFMALMHPALAGVAAIPLPFLFLGAWLYTRKARSRSREVRRTTGEMNAFLHDNIAGIAQIKAYTIEESEWERFNKKSDAVRQSTLKVMRAWAWYKPGMNFVSAVGILLVLWMGTRLHFQGELTPGELASFLVILGLFYDPIRVLHQLNQMAQTGIAAGERVFDMMDAEEEARLDEGKPLKQVKGKIAFEDVSFSYEGKVATIKGLSLEAKAGQTIALVGETGAGKSTVLQLLGGYYHAQGGKITLDDVETKAVPKRWLRAQMGYVSQESFLFNDTVRENLLVAVPGREVSEERLWQVLEAAHAAKFVRAMPEGLETKVGERGVKLSVGEKQRLSIARALLKDPPILLLDEATASVDNATEQLMQEALDRLMKGRTCIVIAHRLSTIENADCIYVLDQGRVVESGKHGELLAKGGAYAALSREVES